MIIYDRRWDGPHGIGRFSTELRKRLHGSITDLHGSHPVSARGLAEIEWLPRRLVTKDFMFFSPGYCPSVTWTGPTVITVHDLIHLRVEGERSRGKQAYYNYVVRNVIRRPNTLVLTVSQFSKQDIVEWAGVDEQRVVVVGNGVDASFSPAGDAVKRRLPYVLHVGNTKPHKNLPALLTAIAQLDGVDLVLSADPDPDLLRLAAELGISARVTLVGGIPEGELAHWYRGAAAVAIVSHYEGFGLPALEGMACGVPVVAADGSALREVVGAGGLRVDPNDVTAIASAIQMAIYDQSVRESLTSAGIRHAAQFSWDAVADRVRKQVGQWL